MCSHRDSRMSVHVAVGLQFALQDVSACCFHLPYIPSSILEAYREHNPKVSMKLWSFFLAVLYDIICKVEECQLAVRTSCRDKVDYIQYGYCGDMHIVYTQFRCILCTLRQYAIWLLPSGSLHILQVGLDVINLLWGHCLAVFLFSNVIIMAKRPKNLLVRANRYGVKLHNDPKQDCWHQGLFEECQGTQQPYCLLHITTIAILRTQCGYCLRNMYIACALFLYTQYAYCLQ